MAGEAGRQGHTRVCRHGLGVNLGIYLMTPGRSAECLIYRNDGFTKQNNLPISKDNLFQFKFKFNF